MEMYFPIPLFPRDDCCEGLGLIGQHRSEREFGNVAPMTNAGPKH